MCSGGVVFFWMLTATAAMLIGSFAPQMREVRPGVIDSLLGLLIGIPLGSYAFRRMRPFIYEMLAEAQGSYWRVRYSSESLKAGLIFGGFLIAAVLPTMGLSFLGQMLGLNWPLCAVISFVGLGSYILTTAYQYLKWYNSLPY